MVHLTCKQTKTAKEDLDYVVKKFLRAETHEFHVNRGPTDCHTQTVSPDKRHVSVLNFIPYNLFYKTVKQFLMTFNEFQESGDAKDPNKSPKPQVLWSLFLNLPASDIKLNNAAPKNVHLCSGPDLELDFDFAVNQVSLCCQIRQFFFFL